MVDERIASENHPSSANPEALAREYGGPAVQHPGTPVQGLAMAQPLPSVQGMTAEQAAAEHSRCMADPAFLARLNNAGGKKAALAHLEAISAARFGNPATAPQKPGSGPRYELDANLAPEERAAATELAERAVRLADAGPEGQREVDAMHEPRGTMDYSNIHHGAGRQLMFEAGISPIAANYIASQAAEYSRLDDAGYDAAQSKAVDLISRQPGGAKVLADAKAFLDKLPDNSPLSRVAVMAASSVVGIQEMARLARRGARAAK